ncbi:MAG: hypothetical protein M1830_001958 [Pleopsidium flavum]|nr:MAG: hypothetical protein M1830_001958 [Pleopsidium flavum]
MVNIKDIRALSNSQDTRTKDNRLPRQDLRHAITVDPQITGHSIVLSHGDQFPRSLNRPSNPRPNKRHKMNGPIVTRYPVPPHLTLQHGSPQGFGGPSYNKPGFPPQQSPYAPPTPVSAYPHPQHQWPHPQHQPYKAAYPQGHPYPHPVSAQAPPQHHGFFPPSGLYQQQGSPQSIHSVRPMHPPSSQIPPSYQNWSQQPLQHSPEFGRRASRDFNDGIQLMPAKSRQTSEASFELESEADDLEGLDVPDIRTGPGAMGWHPPKLVGRPFASDYFAEEVIATLPPPPPKPEGSSLSKYFTYANFQDIVRSVRETGDWAAIKVDPVFQCIPDNGDSVALEYLTAHRGSLDQEADNMDVETEEGELSQEQTTASQDPDKQDSHGWSVMDNLEQALNSGDFTAAAKQHQTTPPGSIDAEKVQLQEQAEDSAEEASARAAEEKLAALGVTGLPKPVRAPARPYPPPTAAPELNHDLAGQSSRCRSRSPENHASLTVGSISAMGQHASHASPTSSTRFREREPLSPRYNSHNGRQHASPNRRDSYGSPSGDYERRRPTERSRSQQIVNPPPSRRGKISNYDGANVSPASSDSSHDHTHAPQPPQSGYFNGYAKHGSNGHAASPPTIRSERSNPRKREYDQRESSEERELERRRQADDVTPKLKRRQPKVAEAYSKVDDGKLDPA